MKITKGQSREHDDSFDYNSACTYKFSETHRLFGCCQNCANPEQFKILKANNR
jgi:hypothetical protein